MQAGTYNAACVEPVENRQGKGWAQAPHCRMQIPALLGNKTPPLHRHGVQQDKQNAARRPQHNGKPPQSLLPINVPEPNLLPSLVHLQVRRRAALTLAPWLWNRLTWTTSTGGRQRRLSCRCVARWRWQALQLYVTASTDTSLSSSSRKVAPALCRAAQAQCQCCSMTRRSSSQRQRGVQGPCGMPLTRAR